MLLPARQKIKKNISFRATQIILIALPNSDRLARSSRKSTVILESPGRWRTRWLSSTGRRRKRPVSVGCGVSLRAPILSRHDRHPAPERIPEYARRAARIARRGRGIRGRDADCRPLARCRALRQGRPRRPWRRRTAPLRGIATTTGTGAYLAPWHRSRLASRRTLDRSRESQSRARERASIGVR